MKINPMRKLLILSAATKIPYELFFLKPKKRFMHWRKGKGHSIYLYKHSIMEDLTIKKGYFVDDEPSEKVRQTIVSGMHAPVIRRSLMARFRYRYVAVPVFLFMIF